MATLVELRGYVRDWLSTSSTRLSDSSLTQIINIVMREIYRKRDLRFGELTASVSITGGTETATLPTTFSRPNIFWYTTLTNTAAITEMNEISYEEYRDTYANGDGATGEPVDFAIYGSTIYLGPTPARNITATLDYYGIPAMLAADADHNDLTDNGWEAVLFSALAYASLYMLEDERGAAVFGSLAKGHLDTLVREHGRSRWASRQFPQMVEPK